jgi:hypothetical protein
MGFSLVYGLFEYLVHKLTLDHESNNFGNIFFPLY